MRYLCINCWRAPEEIELEYTCAGCPAPVLPPWANALNVSRARRPVKELKAGLFQALTSPPRCSKCQSKVDLYCTCGHALSGRTRLERDGPAGLGLAGTMFSGKTTYLLTVLDQLRNNGNSSLGFLGIDDTELRFGELMVRVRGGIKPLVTPPITSNSANNKMNFAWEVVDGTQRRAILAVHDVGGETWTEYPLPRIPAFDRYLEHVFGFVFLMDGGPIAADLDLKPADAWETSPREGDGGTLDRLLLALIEDRLGPSRRKQLDIAIVISKGDRLWSHSEWAAVHPAGDPQARSNQTRELLRRSGRGDILKAAGEYFKDVECFVVSSIGFQPDAANVDGDRLTRPLKPLGVTEPIDWLLKSQGWVQ